MLKFLIGLLASVSSVFISGANKSNVAPLNTAIIAYQETYYAPAVADLGNLPWAKKISSEVQTSIVQTSITKPTPVKVKPTLPPPAPLPAPSPPSPPPAPVMPPQDPYLAIPEPAIDWFNIGGGLTLRGTSSDTNPVTLPQVIIDRQYWRIEAVSYWAPKVTPKPTIQNNYFKLEVYEAGTNKLIYTMTSGTDDGTPKYQSFRKPGTYYFKAYSIDPSQWEVTVTVSLKLAQ